MSRNVQGCLVISIGLVLGLAAVTLYQRAFEQIVQQPLCLSYATTHPVPGAVPLSFLGVNIANGRSPHHVCEMINPQNGAIVELRFDDAEAPYWVDTIDALGMVLVFLLGGLSVLRWYPKWPTRHP
jgi:hypothetical protein